MVSISPPVVFEAKQSRLRRPGAALEFHHMLTRWQPMRAEDHVHDRRADGVAIDAAGVELAEELLQPAPVLILRRHAQSIRCLRIRG